MDVHVHRSTTEGLRQRGVDVLTAQEDGSTQLEDGDLLDRATSLGRAVFTYDDDFLAEAHRRQATRVPFAGVIYIPLHNVRIGACITDLTTLADNPPEEMANQIHYLPLRLVP